MTRASIGICISSCGSSPTSVWWDCRTEGSRRCWQRSPGAQPKIAAYPFTTLHPNLGVAELEGGHTLVLADVPGLIEGAATAPVSVSNSSATSSERAPWSMSSTRPPVPRPPVSRWPRCVASSRHTAPSSRDARRWSRSTRSTFPMELWRQMRCCRVPGIVPDLGATGRWMPGLLLGQPSWPAG